MIFALVREQRSDILHPEENFDQSAAVDGDPAHRPISVQGRFLPRALINAQAATKHPHNCMDLKNGGRRTLRAILAFYNLKTKAPIFPYREALAMEAGVSIPTLYRDLAELEARAYIVRLPQRHKSTATGANAGKFWLAPIQLTDKALLLLGLNNVIHKQPSLNVIDGIYIDKERTTIKQSSLKNTIPAGIPPKKASTPGNDIDRATKLPKDLLWIRDRGVTPGGIFRLMGLATRNRKRLSDIIAYRATRIAQLDLRHNALFSYLLALIGTDVDYAFLASESRGEQDVAEERRETDALQQRLRHHCDGYELWHGEQMVGIFRAASDPRHEDFIEMDGGTVPFTARVASTMLRKKWNVRRPDGYDG